MVVKGLGYCEFKLFLLSLVWRAGISANGMFEHVSLGPHEERLREMILTQNPDEPERYAVLIFALNFHGQWLPDFWVQPTPLLIRGHRCYQFVFGGFMFLYFVSSHALPDRYVERVIHLDGTIRIVEAEVDDFKFLRESWSLMGTAFPDDF